MTKCRDDLSSSVPDILTCGQCRLTFELTDFIRFIWHKVLGCSNDSDKVDFEEGNYDLEKGQGHVTASEHDGDERPSANSCGAVVANDVTMATVVSGNETRCYGDDKDDQTTDSGEHTTWNDGEWAWLTLKCDL